MIGSKLGQFEEDYKGGIAEADFLAAKCYFIKTLKPIKGKTDVVKFKGVKNPSIEVLQDIRRDGTHDIIQEQWKRQFGGVLTYQNMKRIVLHTKRFVNNDGTTRPF